MRDSQLYTRMYMNKDIYMCMLVNMYGCMLCMYCHFEIMI
jgi:hypothetical protein